LRFAFALAVLLPLLGVLLVSIVGITVVAKLVPRFTPAEKLALQRTWTDSTLLRLLLRDSKVEDIAAELVPLTVRTKHFYSPAQIACQPLARTA
jgi:hypothetical protein